MDDEFSIVGKINNIIETLESGKDKEALKQLKDLKEKIEKYNIEPQLNYLNKLENELK